MRWLASILVVNDEPAIRHMLKTILEEAGCNVTEAADTLQAVGLASRRSFDLVITDIVMLHKAGIKLIQHLRRTSNDLKIIAICGAMSGQYVHLAKEIGADAVFGKPLRMDAVLEEVARLLGPAEK